jgi:prepilin-type N-terminal cleavage/methylation domain-containing protein
MASICATRSSEGEMTRPRRHAAGRAGEAGFTMIEVMIAALVVAVGIAGLLGSFAAVTKGGLSAQRHQQLLAYGQREIERLRTLDYGTQMGLTSLPVQTGDGNVAGDATPNTPSSPTYYVSGTGLKIMARYSDKTSGLATGVSPNPEPMDGPGDAKLTDARVNPGPESFSAGATTGKIYRYVTWRSEHCPASTTSGITNPCTGNDSKRITIAIVPDKSGNGSGPAKPIWLSTVISDPNSTPTGVSPPRAPSTATVSAQPFYLTDTRCSYATRQAITASHQTHDTSLATSSCASATSIPDLMDKAGTTDNPSVPVYDYSSEVARPAPGGLTQKAGLALMRGATDCPTSTTTALSTVHTWATQAMPSGGFTIPADASAALSFWTQTLDGAPANVTMCATLRVASTRAVVGSGSYVQAAWPTAPTQVSFAWDLTGPVIVAAGDRLLLTVSLKASPTATDDVLLLYDHPSFQSSLFVATSTPLA